jgi:hypothetical protein
VGVDLWPRQQVLYIRKTQNMLGTP